MRATQTDRRQSATTCYPFSARPSCRPRPDRMVRCFRQSVGEANIFVPIFPLLIVTSTPVGTAVLIGTVWFLSAWSPYFDPSGREHSPYVGSEDDDEWDLRSPHRSDGAG
jgi:hypothetical protein